VVNKQKITFFIGSGFSKSIANIPIQNEFLCKVLVEKRSEWILKNIPNDNEREMISKMIDNGAVETLMSYLYHCDLMQRDEKNKYKKNSIDNYNRASINFRMAMNQFLYCYHVKNNFNKIAKNNFFSLLNSIPDTYEIIFITTNYDLVLEDILCNEKIDYQLREKNNEKNIQLLKLHGSINWLEDSENKKPENKGSLPIHIEENLTRSKDILCCHNIDSNVKPDYFYKYQDKQYTPITIPFYYQKDNWYSGRWFNIFRNCIWKKAKDELLSSNTIVFIGFGFAPADFPIISLLNEANWYEKILINIDESNKRFNEHGFKINYCSGKYLQDISENDKTFEFVRSLLK